MQQSGDEHIPLAFAKYYHRLFGELGQSVGAKLAKMCEKFQTSDLLLIVQSNILTFLELEGGSCDSIFEKNKRQIKQM
jgi:hypothetical protein